MIPGRCVMVTWRRWRIFETNYAAIVRKTPSTSRRFARAKPRRGARSLPQPSARIATHRSKLATPAARGTCHSISTVGNCMPWLSQFFINPALVIPGAALIAAPILIHLINRMRYRRVRFAAMEFLLQSQQRNRRKLLLEQLLLLLLRTVVVLALVALIARPFFDPKQLLILRGEKTLNLVLLDDSGSMRDSWGELDAFHAGLDVVRKIADQGARQPGTQTLTLLLLSDVEQPLFTQATLDPAFRQELDAKLENLTCSHRALDLPAGLQSAAQHLKGPVGAKNFYLVSDFRSRDWEQDSTFSASVKELDAAGVSINLVKSVPERHANLGVTELSGNVNVAAANVPVRMKVGVKNFGAEITRNVRLGLWQDGQRLPLSVMFDKLEPGSESFREFDVVFPTAGNHEIKTVLPEDALESDNVRHLALSLTDANPVLIISGDLGDGEADYVRDALAPAAGITGFAPVVESPEFLRRQPLQQYQCIYMVNVADLPADALRLLEDYVAAGGGLAWFLGPQVRPAYYNTQLYKKGAGLFPVPLGTVADLAVDETNPAPDLKFEDHPVFRAFQGQDNPFVESVRVGRYFSVAKDWKPEPQVQTIARFRNQVPAFFEHQFGLGRILTSLSSCGTRWNDWPRNPSYVLLQLELEKFVARNDRAVERRIVGEPFFSRSIRPSFEVKLKSAPPTRSESRDSLPCRNRLRPRPRTEPRGRIQRGPLVKMSPRQRENSASNSSR